MKGRGVVVCVVLALSLGGCVTADTQFTRIGPGPGLAYAKAKCQLMASSADRGYAASGSATYVALVAAGNMLENMARESQFMDNCMVLQGWQAVPEGAAAPVQAVRAEASTEQPIETVRYDATRAEAPTLQRTETIRYNGGARLPYGGLRQSD